MNRLRRPRRPSRSATTAPSCMNAVLSAVNACVRRSSRSCRRARRASGAVVHADARSRSVTPSGSVAQSDSSGAKRPFTNTIVCQSVAPNVNGASSSRSTSPLGDASSANSCSAIGATLVKCQSSFFVVGKPSAAKRSNAARRESTARHAGAAASRRQLVERRDVRLRRAAASTGRASRRRPGAGRRAVVTQS